MESAFFTNDEKDRINSLYATNFVDIKPDDALLIAKWESYKATQDAEFEAKMQAIKEESETRLAYAENEYKLAIDSLNALHDAAIARLEMLTNGQTQ